MFVARIIQVKIRLFIPAQNEVTFEPFVWMAVSVGGPSKGRTGNLQVSIGEYSRW